MKKLLSCLVSAGMLLSALTAFPVMAEENDEANAGYHDLSDCPSVLTLEDGKSYSITPTEGNEGTHYLIWKAVNEQPCMVYTFENNANESSETIDFYSTNNYAHPEWSDGCSTYSGLDITVYGDDIEMGVYERVSEQIQDGDGNLVTQYSFSPLDIEDLFTVQEIEDIPVKEFVLKEGQSMHLERTEASTAESSKNRAVSLKTEIRVTPLSEGSHGVLESSADSAREITDSMNSLYSQMYGSAVTEDVSTADITCDAGSLVVSIPDHNLPFFSITGPEEEEEPEESQYHDLSDCPSVITLEDGKCYKITPNEGVEDDHFLIWKAVNEQPCLVNGTRGDCLDYMNNFAYPSLSDGWRIIGRASTNLTVNGDDIILGAYERVTKETENSDGSTTTTVVVGAPENIEDLYTIEEVKPWPIKEIVLNEGQTIHFEKTGSGNDPNEPGKGAYVPEGEILVTPSSMGSHGTIISNAEKTVEITDELDSMFNQMDCFYEDTYWDGTILDVTCDAGSLHISIAEENLQYFIITGLEDEEDPDEPEESQYHDLSDCQSVFTLEDGKSYKITPTENNEEDNSYLIWKSKNEKSCTVYNFLASTSNLEARKDLAVFAKNNYANYELSNECYTRYFTVSGDDIILGAYEKSYVETTDGNGNTVRNDCVGAPQNIEDLYIVEEIEYIPVREIVLEEGQTIRFEKTGSGHTELPRKGAYRTVPEIQATAASMGSHGTMTKVGEEALEITDTPDSTYNQMESSYVDTYVDGDTVDITCDEGSLIISMAEERLPYFIVSNLFEDVPETMWYHDVVYETFKYGLMTGTNASHFEPNSLMTRGMVATVLYRMAGSPAVSGNSGFSDVKDGMYYSDAVTWAVQTGVVTGYTTGDKAGTFGPNDNVTREQLCTMAYRYLDKVAGKDTSAQADLDGFTDKDRVSGYAVEAVKYCVAKGIISGAENGTKLNPVDNATRAECAKILLNTSNVE